MHLIIEVFLCHHSINEVLQMVVPRDYLEGFVALRCELLSFGEG
jgi:hypothetical protein